MIFSYYYDDFKVINVSDIKRFKPFALMFKKLDKKLFDVYLDWKISK